MKKPYTKPQILFEDFTLSTNIAAGCEHKANFQMYSCSYFDEDFGISIFNNQVSGCQATPHNGRQDDYNGICYHVPIESNNLFQS